MKAYVNSIYPCMNVLFQENKDKGADMRLTFSFEDPEAFSAVRDLLESLQTAESKTRGSITPNMHVVRVMHASPLSHEDEARAGTPMIAAVQTPAFITGLPRFVHTHIDTPPPSVPDGRAKIAAAKGHANVPARARRNTPAFTDSSG